MNDATETPNRIVEFFSGKTVFITGGSGTVGKVLIEKLLRSCNCLKIYVLLRDKKGKNAKQRLQEMFQGPLFESVKKKHGESIFNKVAEIAGDIDLPNLGLSLEDRKKLNEEVEIIYHSAAITKFEESFKSTVITNVKGTKLMLSLAQECKKLLVSHSGTNFNRYQLFCYISSAYCHEDQEVVFEKIYPRSDNPHLLIQLCESLEEDVLQLFCKKLLGKRNNYYTFSKALSEALIEEVIDELPIIIMRPSVIIPVWKDPIPGFTDTLNNISGLLVGAGKGAIRTMYARKGIIIDCCPADILANMLIVAVFDHCTNKFRKIYHVTTSEDTKLLGITIQKVLDVGKEIITSRIAFSTVLWYPNGSLKEWKIEHYFAFFFYQLVPAVFVDTIFFLVGAKPFLIRIQKRIWKSYQMFEYYANREWTFDRENSNAARSLLNSTEIKEFPLNSDGFDLQEYIYQSVLFIRHYRLKEPDEDMSSALKRMKMLYYLDLFCKLLIATLFFYYIYKLIF